MSIRLVFLTVFILQVVTVDNVTAVELKVDFAYPPFPYQAPEPENLARHQATLKDGWMFFSPQDDRNWQYDLWRHDPRTMENVGNSGIDVSVGCGYDGDTSLTVAGMEPVWDSEMPLGSPTGEPIANSYLLSHRHYGNHVCTGRPFWGSIFMTLSGRGSRPVAPAIYRVSSYHNDSAGFLLEGFDVMPSITVASADPQFPNAVTPIEQAYNVPIQHVLDDDKLQAHEIVFIADGTAPVTIHYMSPEGYDHRQGGAAVLNAFIITSTPILAAYKPDPTDGLEDLHPAVTLNWNVGAYASSHNVYLGTDEAAVEFADENSPEFRASVEQNSFDPGPLEMGTTYYWRIDEINDADADSPWKGFVWSFTTRSGHASAPQPADGGTDVDRQPRLRWSPGLDAAWHDVFFGTDFSAVSAAEKSSPEYRGRLAAAYYDYFEPGLLELGQTYYWRIDAINAGYPPAKGSVWSFTAHNYEVIDDIESYSSSRNPIERSWTDGLLNGTGSRIALATTAATPPDPVHSGVRSMKFSYDNGNSSGAGPHYYSEIQRTFVTPSDWTRFGLSAVTVHFYGAPNNDAGPTEQMYMALEDDAGHIGVVPYDGDMSDIRSRTWRQWNIDLQDPRLTAASVDTTAIKNVRIGFGVRGGDIPGGSGTVYFDDIRLYLPRCIERYEPVGDFNGDCFVGPEDLEIIADDWLKHDYTIDNVPGPVLRYSFDAADGYNVPDITGNHYDGYTHSQAGPVEPPIEDGYMRFQHETRENAYVVEVPTEVFNEKITNEITVSVWVNWDDPETMPGGNTILFGAMGGPGDLYVPAFIIETDWRESSVRFWDSSLCYHAAYDGLEPEDWSGAWNHYVFVKSVTGRYLRIYHNGRLRAESYSDRPMPTPIDLAWIGINPDFPIYVKMYLHDIYTGLLDEFRIYDRALSEAEIAYIYSGGDAQYVPLTSPANLYDPDNINSKTVNFNDYALFMNNWLTQIWWP